MGLSSARPSHSKIASILAVVAIAASGAGAFYLLDHDPVPEQPETAEVERGTVSLTASAALVTYAVLIGISDPPETVRSGSSATGRPMTRTAAAGIPSRSADRAGHR